MGVTGNRGVEGVHTDPERNESHSCGVLEACKGAPLGCCDLHRSLHFYSWYLDTSRFTAGAYVA